MKRSRLEPGGHETASESRDVPCQYMCTSVLESALVEYNLFAILVRELIAVGVMPRN